MGTDLLHATAITGDVHFFHIQTPSSIETHKPRKIIKPTWKRKTHKFKTNNTQMEKTNPDRTSGDRSGGAKKDTEREALPIQYDEKLKVRP